MAPRAPLALLAILLGLAAAGCGPARNTGDGRPKPSPVGNRTGAATALSVDAAGGALDSPDGRLTVTVPPGALAAPLQLTIDEITNTAPGGLGPAYRLGPSGTPFAVPVALTFRAGATGIPLASLAISTQEGQGYWLRPAEVTREAIASTLAVATSHFSDWALVTAATARDLRGTFRVDSTLTDYPPYSAAGEATLNYAGDGPDRSYYLQWGTIALPAQFPWGAATCAPAAPRLDLRTNIAELRPALSRFDWGVSGHWELDCGTSGGQSILSAVDTVGIAYLGCARGYAGAPVLGQDRIQGAYAIDCGARGRITATWDFASLACGGPCSGNPDPVCHEGVIDCSTGAATCVDGAPRANGTTCDDGNACTQTDTCQAGACVGASPVVCLALDPCHDPGVCDPTSGICSDPARADGSACSDGSVCTQVDSCQAGVCVGASPVTCQPLDGCHLAGTCDPVAGCSNPAAPDGTTCDDGNGCTPTESCLAGVCTAESGVICVALDPCHDPGACDPGSGICSSPAKPDGTSCSDGSVCTQVDSCQAGACVGASPVTCQPLDACHLAGTCDPVAGCSNPAAPDGTTCSDGSACTQVDTCQAGTCTGASPVVCVALDACHDPGTCEPASGVCSDPARADGTTCSDGSVCTQVDTCQAGACTGASPVACVALDACHLAGSCDPIAGCSNPLAPDGTACGGGLTCSGGACASRTVAGSRLVTAWGGAGAEAPAVPADALVPPLAIVEAWAPDGQGGWLQLAGTLSADGSYAIPLVPVGSYLLVVVDGAGTVRAVETSSSTVDLGWDVLGRSSAVPAALATPVDVAATGLDPWDPAGDELQLSSASPDLQRTVLSGAVLAAGAVAGTASLDWSAAAPGGLPLLAAGDVAWVHRLGGRSTGGAAPVAYRVATQAVSRSDLTLSDGQAATLSFDLTAAAATQSGALTVDWDLPAFEALLGAMGPSASAGGHALRVAAAAHALAAPAPAPASRLGYPDLLEMELPAGSARVTPAGPLAYGQFLGASWLEWRGVSFEAAVGYLAPGATVALQEQVSAGSREPVAGLPAGAIAPVLSPAQALQVNGQSAATPQTGVGLAPALSWQAPAIGAPSRYQVELFELRLSGADGSARLPVAVLTTAATSLALPPGLLSAGATYYARVTAHAQAGDGFATAPLRHSLVGAWAGALTATFAP